MKARASIVAAAIAVAWLQAPWSVAAESGLSCPLSIGEQVESVKKFAPIAKFLTNEPRCFNCHGGVNPHIEGVGRDPVDRNAPVSTVAHGGGAQDRGGKGLMASGCEDCHGSMVPRGKEPESRWFTAPPSSSFVGKDATKLCRQLKKFHTTSDHFLGHLKNDNGGITFVETAFLGNRGLNPEWETQGYPRAPPSMSHAAFMRLGDEWVRSMGGKFQGDERCGCEVRLILGIEHHVAPRRDSSRARIGGPLYDGTVRFELSLAPFPVMPGQKGNPTGIPLHFGGDATVVRQFSIGHIASMAAGQGTQTETWSARVTIDPENETLKLRLQMFPDEMDAWWVTPGGREEVTVPLHSEISLLDQSKAPISMSSRSGSRHTYTQNGRDFQETLTVSIPARSNP